MKYVIVGGGIAGVSCTYELLRGTTETDQIVLISASEHVKTVNNWTKLGQFAEFFTVTESKLFSDDKRLVFLKAEVTDWLHNQNLLKTTKGDILYDRICIATGATPRIPWKHPKILALRDSDSADYLQQVLKDTRKVAIIGNGGIATELVYELKNVIIEWVIRDVYPSSVFFLPEVSKFLEERILQGRITGSKADEIHKRERFVISEKATTSKSIGCALGPDWSTGVDFDGSSDKHTVNFHCSTEVLDVKFGENVRLKLSNDKEVDCDLAIWAIGVDPATDLWKKACPELNIGYDGGILVNEEMKTNISNVYACGDVCTVNWPTCPNTWKQMRLWTQARQMGIYCARSMVSKNQVELDFCFEVFAHVTYFCGMKIIFLGDYKGEQQGDDWYTRERVIGDREYVCCVMKTHRVVGATLIGETQLEETLENLILNKTDLSMIEEHFLDPGIDIEDYFD